MSTWVRKGGYEELLTRNCYISLEPRPHYCDRGNFIAKSSHRDDVKDSRIHCDLDGADGWPRYYFDEGRAKAEIEAWALKRKELL